MRFMYVGPSIVGVATRNTIYEDTPESLADGIEVAPYLSGLCVPLERMADALKQINRKQGGIYNLYTQALSDSAEIQRKVQQKGV